MVNSPSLRQIFSDKESLREYSEGHLPSFDDIRRRLFLSERAQDNRLPDHYYYRGRELTLNGIETLSDLLSKGLHRLASTDLELIGNRVHVKSECWPDWQELLTFCPPLPLISGVLWRECFTPGMRDPVALANFMREWIVPNTKYTCIPSPDFPQMRRLLRDSGLSDMHIHLTGSTETDVAWQDYLQNPFALYREVSKVAMLEKVREQLEQEVPGFESTLLFYRWLTTAQVLRRGFVHLLFNGAYTPEFDEVVTTLSTSDMLHSRNIVGQMVQPSTSHPMRSVFRTSPNSYSNWSDVSLEGLMYMLIMDRLNQTGDKNMAVCFHQYLLILGFVNRFLVQQVHQSGFDQFQKVTLNEFRSTPEQGYSRRFFQLHGNDSANLAVLEGRFAPKNSVYKTIKLLDQIIKGWDDFRETCRRDGTRVPQLRLVCHFIKEKDRENIGREKLKILPRLAIRHRILRIQNQRKAQSLVTAWDSYPRLKEFVGGVDAASNELEAPPEIYAPVYRYLRRKGFKHFTYHAGEDFHHIIGGLRAMYEAMQFLELHRGDRIGHGTAAGIDPDLWLHHVGETLIMSQGEQLDDLLFLIHLLEKHPNNALCGKLAAIRGEAETLAHQVYLKHYSIHSNKQAWLMRCHCPFHLLHEIDEAMAQPTWSPHEWRHCEEARADSEALELLRLYHRADCRERYHVKILVEIKKYFSSSDLMTLQEILLAELHKREIVLEVLPTSNVRISFYKNHSQHHLWRWLGLDSEKRDFDSFPPVVVGSDDAGIFSTSIYNEYNHIYHQLTTSRRLSHEKATGIVKQLMENARVYGVQVDTKVEDLPECSDKSWR